YKKKPSAPAKKKVKIKHNKTEKEKIKKSATKKSARRDFNEKSPEKKFI
ncbi:hypothetical protein HID67_09310, partial [Pasteurella multocida]|nr:hypothetical protein [Pasteurella multocida]